MSKVNKIFVVFLLIAGVLCLAIGTAFAVDFMAEHPEEFACDLKRPVVVANRPFVEPVVEPLNEVVPIESLLYDVPYSFTLLSGTSFSLDGIYSVDFIENGDSAFGIYGVDDVPFARFLGFVNSTESGVIEFESDYTVFQFLYSEVLIYAMEYEWDASASIGRLSFTDSNEVVTVITIDAHLPTFVFRSSAPFDVVSDNTVHVASVTVRSDFIISNIVDTLVSGLRALGANVGRAFSTIANAIFINADGTGLSTFGILVVVFAAVSLGLSLTRWVLNFCSSWGKRNR